jgi:hypothetical protein
VSTSGSRTKLIDYIDRLAETAGDPKIWLRITTAFRLSKDPCQLRTRSSLEAMMAMADNLGFWWSRPCDQGSAHHPAVSAALLKSLNKRV